MSREKPTVPPSYIETVKDSLAMTYSCGRDGLYIAALRDQPAVFETGLTIMEAVGRLACRVLVVTRLGLAPVAAPSPAAS